MGDENKESPPAGRGRPSDPDYAERKKQAEVERQRLEAERKMFEDREASRKAKLGAAFLAPGEDDDDEDDPKAPTVVKNKRSREEDLGRAFEKPVPLAQAVERSLRGMPASSVAGV